MAFSILCREGQDPKTGEPGFPEYRWSNGDPRPMPNTNPWMLEATGNELTTIRKLFSNIPITTGKSCKWYDEMAKFIFNNLPV